MQSKIYRFVLSLAFPLVAGYIGSIATMSSVNGWYTQLHKPGFAPPDWVFGPVWTILYLLMGVSFYWIWEQPAGSTRKVAFRLYYLQIALNISWSFVFFYYQNIWLAMVVILALLIILTIMIAVLYRSNRKAALINIPYLVWVIFATALNYGFLSLNSGA